LLLRRLRLESLRNRLAKFFEKISYRIGVSALSAQKEEGDDQQANASGTNQAIN
jgi:hypothetical protein